MDKKVFIGTMALGIAAGFWACGGGEIITPTTEDKTMSIDDPNVGPVLDPIKDSAICPGCYGDVVASSSSRQSTAARFGSSSGTLPDIPIFSAESHNSPTSSVVTNIRLSSSSTHHSYHRSSSSAGPVIQLSSAQGSTTVSGVGSCAPSPATIEANGQTTWKFTRGDDVQASQLLSASFAWTFEGGTPATASGTGANAISQSSITYTASGQHTASVSITIGGSHYTVACSPLQVNGAAITGCRCTAENKMPDIAKGQTGKWTVTGCSSRGASIIGYTWGNGVTGDGNTGVFTFTAKKQSLSPVVNVSNDDNTVQAVQCETVTAVDENDPDYIIDGSIRGSYTVGPGTYKMVYACETSTFYQRSIVVTGTNGAVSGTVAGKRFSVAANGRAEVYKSTTSNQSIDVVITSGTAKIACE